MLTNLSPTYLCVLVISLLCYFDVKNFLAWPVQRDIVTSNITISYVLGLALVGGLSPWITRRVWPRAPRGTFVFVAVILAILVVLILKLMGEPTRF